MTGESLFHEAMALPAGERGAFLDRACAGQPELRRAVDELLAAHDASGSFLDAPVHFGQTGAEESSPAATLHTSFASGTVIAGRYKLLEPIGEGGMGAVWMAQQTLPVRRHVAIKLIKAGMDSRQVLARFEAERQALALMDHPHIARVLDAGATPDGRPYFVMELVKGVPITQFCDARKLTPKERLELFVPVCQAIQHAHQKGIIHRDIKPSNVVVALYDDRPVPKVIDFGVAKATGGTLTEQTLNTGFGALVGTPQYMSPEQATFNNLDIDTRSDVYALGVLLYELMTGSPPFSPDTLQQAGLLEVLRIVREVEPPRPSTRLSTADALPSLAASRNTEPKKLTVLLRHELDWIVMKALEKDRSRRYETANGFAADIQRYLSGEPVQAVPPSAGYRLRKFVRKHRGPAIAASLVLTALLLGIGGTTYGLVHAQRAWTAEAEQRQTAQEKQRKAEKQTIRATVAAKAEAEQRALAIKQRDAAEKARNLAREVLDAMTSEATGDELTTQQTITPEQKKFLEEVLTYYQEFAGEDPTDELSRARTAAAASCVARIENRLGRKEQAATAYEKSVNDCAALITDFPDSPNLVVYEILLVEARCNLGDVLRDLVKFKESELQYRAAIESAMQLSQQFPGSPEYREYEADSRTGLAIMMERIGDFVGSEVQYRASLVIRETLATEFPDVAEYRGALANSHDTTYSSTCKTP